MKIPDFVTNIIKIKFGKESKSDKPEVKCPKCKSQISVYNGLTKEYICSECGNTWEDK